MALKQWHQTRWNGDKWNKDGLNTDRDVAYSSTYTHPSPNRASLSMNAAPYMYIYFPLTKCTVRIQNKQSYRRGNLPHACDLYDQYKTTNAQ